jgi:hypothetical protein
LDGLDVWGIKNGFKNLILIKIIVVQPRGVDFVGCAFATGCACGYCCLTPLGLWYIMPLEIDFGNKELHFD